MLRNVVDTASLNYETNHSCGREESYRALLSILSLISLVRVENWNLGVWAVCFACVLEIRPHRTMYKERNSVGLTNYCLRSVQTKLPSTTAAPALSTRITPTTNQFATRGAFKRVRVKLCIAFLLSYIFCLNSDCATSLPWGCYYQTIRAQCALTARYVALWNTDRDSSVV
jgi:hypothetical protein